MLDRAALIWGLNSASTLLASMSFGHCQYISVVECTARYFPYDKPNEKEL